MPSDAGARLACHLRGLDPYRPDRIAPRREGRMTLASASDRTLALVDPATRLLVRLAAVITGRPEGELRPALLAARDGVPAVWVEELILQSYLFAGFPR